VTRNVEVAAKPAAKVFIGVYFIDISDYYINLIIIPYYIFLLSF